MQRRTPGGIGPHMAAGWTYQPPSGTAWYTSPEVYHRVLKDTFIHWEYDVLQSCQLISNGLNQLTDVSSRWGLANSDLSTEVWPPTTWVIKMLWPTACNHITLNFVCTDLATCTQQSNVIDMHMYRAHSSPLLLSFYRFQFLSESIKHQSRTHYTSASSQT